MKAKSSWNGCKITLRQAILQNVVLFKPEEVSHGKSSVRGKQVILDKGMNTSLQSHREIIFL